MAVPDLSRSAQRKNGTVATGGVLSAEVEYAAGPHSPNVKPQGSRLTRGRARRLNRGWGTV